VSEIRRKTAAVDEYLRALHSSARDQAIAEAEEEVCRAWTEELDRVRHVTELGVASAQASYQAAQMLVRAQQSVGDLEGLTQAQQRLERAAGQQRRSHEAAEVLLDVVTEELELLALAAEERETVALANRIWVISAGRAACGAGIGGLRAGTGLAADADPESTALGDDGVGMA
jgi:hypothetical protein